MAIVMGVYEAVVYVSS